MSKKLEHIATIYRRNESEIPMTSENFRGISLRIGEECGMKLGLVIALLVVALACSHRPVHVTISERKCVKGTVEVSTLHCQAMQPGDAAVTNNPCPTRMIPRPMSVCVVVDPKSGALTDVVVAKSQDPFDTDGDEGAADKPKKHSVWFWKNKRDKD
jgi:hypothetical protein